MGGPPTTSLASALDRLRRVGQHLPGDLRDEVAAHGSAAVPALVALATDERLNRAAPDDPSVWAPLHAATLLGDIGDPAAVEPLLRLLGMDDDWMAEALPVAFGKIGRPALGPLRAALADPALDVWAAGWAAQGLKELAARHPELRREVIDALRAYLDVDGPKDERTDADSLHGFVVSYLCDLRAVEAAPSIRRAYREDRIDPFFIGTEDVEDALGVPIGLSVEQAVEQAASGIPPRRPAPFLLGTPPAEDALARFLTPPTDRYVGPKVGRNEPCPCGSGKKYKKCHGR
jgi:hypothetical protein